MKRGRHILKIVWSLGTQYEVKTTKPDWSPGVGIICDCVGRGVGRTFSRWVVLNATFQKLNFCTDLVPNTLYRKCIKFAHKRGGGGRPTTRPPFPTPLVGLMTCFPQRGSTIKSPTATYGHLISYRFDHRPSGVN